MRRVERSAMLHDTDREEGAKAVDALVARFLSAGLLDDRAYAEARTASLHRQGKGVRAIRQALAQKGVSPDDAAAALDALTAEIGPTDPEAAGIGLREADFAAAVTYARRRRLGPYRSAARADNRERDLAALGRQGFGYDTARRVIEAEDVETLEAERDAALDPDAPL
jgi:regulatory protein